MLDDFARFVDEAFGVDRPPALATLRSPDLLGRASEALGPAFVERGGVYERPATTTPAAVAKAVAAAIDVRFASASPVHVPRVVGSAFAAASRRSGGGGEQRAKAMLRAARDAGQPELAARIELAIDARPPLGRLLDEGSLGVEVLLGIVWTDDPERTRRAVDAQLERADAQPYGPASGFEVGDVMDHPKLGRGIITSLEDTRFVVRFADGERKLARVKATAVR